MQGVNLTYGEYWVHIKWSMKMIDGIWILDKPNVSQPTQMNREDATIYYTQKIKAYWEKDYDV